MKIFWSWQADRDSKTGQYFVRDALKEAAKQLGEELELSEADRLEVDHDTKGVPGTPPIVDTIFDKIEEATVFVADVTPVGNSLGGKLLPNPNVMIELGYARRARGFQRLILVANSTHLTKPEDLPFDLRGSRGPTVYELNEGADGAARKAVQKELVASLRLKLNEIIAFDRDQRALTALSGIEAAKDDRTIWFDEGATLSFVDAFSRHAKGSVRLPPGPHSFMRIRPAIWPDTIRTARLSPAGGRSMMAVGRGHNGDWGQTKDGILSYWFSQDSGPPIEAQTIAQWFAETGVAWGVWTQIVSDGNPPWFYGKDVMKWWGHFLETAINEISVVGGKGPFRVDAGIVGIAGARWEMPKTDGALFAAPGDIHKSTVEVTTDRFTQHRFLAALFNRLTDKFGFAGEITVEQVRSIIAE